MILQTMIVITGFLAIWFSQDKNKNLRKLAPIIGLIGQPFWFYSSILAEQYGIFILSILYTLAWTKGLLND